MGFNSGFKGLNWNLCVVEISLHERAVSDVIAGKTQWTFQTDSVRYL